MKAKILFVLILLGLTASAALGVTAQPAQAVTPPPTVGVIRWDGWYSNPPNSQERLMTPTKWQKRLPFFAQILNSGATVTVREDSQAVIDREIQYAHAAGINYWAFDYYAPADLNPGAVWGDPEYGLHLYLTSPYMNEINFSLILLGGPALGTKADWTTKTVPRIVTLLQKPTYQKVKGAPPTRPLIYVFNIANTIAQFGSQTLARAAFDALRQAAKAAGLSDPYIVGLAFNLSTDAPKIKALGLNAVSSYDAIILSGIFQQLPYKRLAQSNVAFWNQALTKGLKIVPPVSVGFDPRPVMATKVGYNRYKNTPYYAQGTPQEIAANLKNALYWTSHHAAAADANTILVYAWNENAEGGWLTPMLDPTLGNARLNAIGGVLNAR